MQLRHQHVWGWPRKCVWCMQVQQHKWDGVQLCSVKWLHPGITV